MAYSLLLLAVLAIGLNFHTSFRINTVKLNGKADSMTRRSCMTMSSVQPIKRALLDSSTLWRISITLTKSGSKSIEAIARVRFIEDRNYEPPQGRLFVEDDFNGLIKVDEKGYAGSWTLSEDKDDRKDGLWIWGLFQEPKYPFLYFSLGKLQNKKPHGCLPQRCALTFVPCTCTLLPGIFKSILLPSGQEEPIFGGEGVPNDRLNIRMDHVRDEVKGAVLSGGLMEYQITEMVKADPFGVGGTINVGDKFIAGTIDIRPVLGSVNDKEDEELMAKILQSISPASASPAVN